MFKRLPLVCTALLMLAACSSNNSDSAAPAPGATPTASSAPVSTASTPAAATSSATAAGASTTAAPAAAATVAAASKPTAPFVDTGEWVEGKDYTRIDPAQPTSSGSDKIEVTEVFSYGCPSCFAFHPWADKLAAELPSNARMVFLPASFIPTENWPMLQRVYYTAQALGVADKGNDAMYSAVWKSGELGMMDLKTSSPKPQAAWPTMEDFAKFYTKYGAKADEFIATANSFTINTKMKRADELIKSYGVEGTPTIVVNGKYRFSPATVGSYEKTLRLTQFLVSKEAAGK